MPYESTIPSYIWYLLAIPNEDFHVPSQNYSKALLFCASVLAHEEVVGNS
jgi:hypothetical protein